MKTTQILMLIAVLIGVAFGIAFVKQWVVAPTQTPVEVLADTTAQAYFPVLVGTMETDVEVNKPGQFDFPFENRHTAPLLLGLDKKGCTCQKVEILLLTPEEGKKWPALPPDKGGKPVQLPEAKLKDFPRPPNDPGRWINLEESRPLTLEPGARGWARLGWATKTIKAVRLRAALWMQEKDRGGTRGDTILEVIANIVPAIHVSPGEAMVGEVGSGQPQRVDFWCWSSTRPSLNLKAEPEEPTPCIQSTVTALSPAEGRALEQRMAEEDPESRRRVRCAYKASVLIQAKVGDSLLDLGPFERKIFFRDTADGSEALGIIKGAVRGDVRLVNPDHEDWIRLGRFRHDDGTSREIPVECTQPGMKLAVESTSPATIKATIQEDKDEPGRWLLKVVVPPKTISGMLPHGSRVVLKTTQGNPTQRFQIPIVGNAIRSR